MKTSFLRYCWDSFLIINHEVILQVQKMSKLLNKMYCNFFLTNYECLFFLQLHSVSFHWFLSGLEWILKFEFCLLKLLIFYQKLLWNIRSRLNPSTFWVFESVFEYVGSKTSFLCAQSFNFDQTYLNTGLKTQNVEGLSLDLLSHNNFW